MADFRRLGYFLQIAELGSLTRAAARLRIAQPSLSRQMRLLEQELGVTLFTRGYRGMHLTEAGEILRARIAGPLRQVGHALYEVRALPSDTEGTVIFGMPPSVSGLLGEALLRRVLEAAPRINLHLVESLSGHLLAMMKRGELDAAVLYGPTPAGLNAARLLDDELVLVRAPGSSAERTIDFRKLADLPLALPSEGHGLRVVIESFAGKSRTQLQVKLQLDSLPLLKAAAISGGVCSILPVSSVTAEVAAECLVAVPIRRPNPVRQLFLTMQSQAESLRAVLQVEELARQETASLVANGRWPSAGMFDVGDS